MSAPSDPEERRVLYAALDSFRQYRHAARYNATNLRRQAYYSLPSAHLDILEGAPFFISRKFRDIDNAIDENADIAQVILIQGLSAFGIDSDDESWKGQATENDMNKAISTVNQLYRDWSAEGEPERNASYSPIFDALATYPPSGYSTTPHQYNVLVPGAGLGRLVLELCMLGYAVQGNEISYHQLLVSNYILNCTGQAKKHTLYPWALNFSNHAKRADQLHSVAIPDIKPAEELATRSTSMPGSLNYTERLSMTAGDFIPVYKQGKYESHFYAVVTCFFIDTAPNLISYIETIRHCLKAGGIWINIGPLKWHFNYTATPAEKKKLNDGGETATKPPTVSSPRTPRNFSRPITPEPVSPVATSEMQIDPEQDSVVDNGIGEPGAFDLSNEEVIALLERLGFEVLEESQAPAGNTGYIHDPRSMEQYMYRPAFWVAKKQ